MPANSNPNTDPESIDPAPVPGPNLGRTSLRQLASELGLSLGTVSKALNARPGVSHATAQRVRETAQRLGYVPDRYASVLRRGSTRHIGILVNQLGDPYYIGLLRQAQTAAREAGFDLSFDVYDQQNEHAERFFDEMLARRADGLILIAIDVSADNPSPAYQRVLQEKLPIVMIGLTGEQPQANVSSLDCDRVNGLIDMTNVMIEMGHKHFGIVMAESPDLSTNVRLIGIRTAVKQAGLPDQAVERISYPLLSPDALTQSIIKFFQRDAPRPTVLFCSNDVVAIMTMSALDQLGINVPGDVSVIGFNNIDLAQYVRPSLTTVSQAHHEFGRRAVRHLLDRIADPEVPAQHLVLPTEIVMRQSTAPPK